MARSSILSASQALFSRSLARFAARFGRLDQPARRRCNVRDLQRFPRGRSPQTTVCEVRIDGVPSLTTVEQLRCDVTSVVTHGDQSAQNREEVRQIDGWQRSSLVRRPSSSRGHARARRSLDAARGPGDGGLDPRTARLAGRSCRRRPTRGVGARDQRGRARRHRARDPRSRWTPTHACRSPTTCPNANRDPRLMTRGRSEVSVSGSSNSSANDGVSRPRIGPRRCGASCHRTHGLRGPRPVGQPDLDVTGGLTDGAGSAVSRIVVGEPRNCLAAVRSGGWGRLR